MSEGSFSIGIVGGGAVGLTYAALLSEQADVVVKVRREAQAEAINTQGITFKRRNGGERTYLGIKAAVDAGELAICNAVIVAVKSYDTAAIAHELSSVIAPSAVVLTLQNGLQAYPVLTETLDKPERVFMGVTYVGAHRDDDRTVTNGTNLRTVVDDEVGELADVMTATALDVEVCDDSRQAVWDKLVLNVGQNALSAIAGLTFGEMYESAECLEAAKLLLDELVPVATAEGITFNYDVMEKLRANWKRSSFRPSMWQDLQRGQRTEIDAINGAVTKLGERHGIPTPCNDTICALIKVLEAKANKA